MTLTRSDALALMDEHTASDALRKHMYAVEIAMRAMADRAGEDPEAWGLVGLLHDFDYERHPNAAHSPHEEHPSEGVRILAARGLPVRLGIEADYFPGAEGAIRTVLARAPFDYVIGSVHWGFVFGPVGPL